MSIYDWNHNGKKDFGDDLSNIIFTKNLQTRIRNHHISQAIVEKCHYLAEQ